MTNDAFGPDSAATATEPTWTKSSRSGPTGGNCVEVADLPGGLVGVRNSKDPDGAVLRFTPDEWQAFLGGARLGEFDGFGAA